MVKFIVLYPLQNPNLCLQYCCFELPVLHVFTFQYSNSTIQHCPFTTWFKLAAFLFYVRCVFKNGVKCNMLATQSNIIVFYIPNQYPYFAFKFLRLTWSIRVFQFNVNIDTWCVCCCSAECNMLATQSNISCFYLCVHIIVYLH